MVAVPTAKLTAWADGDALSSTNLNAYLRNPVRFLLARPAARLRQTSAQGVPNTSWEDINFQAEDLDTDPDGVGAHSTSSNTPRFTARYPGWYSLTGSVTFLANSTGYRRARWAVNGSPVDGTQNTSVPAAGVVAEVQPVSTIVALGVGDYVTLQGYQTSGSSLTTNVGATSGVSCSTMTVLWERAIVGDV